MISMLKVLKFGGSSLADAHQFAKVKSIVDADPARRVVIVSAPGKRFSGDHKITDLLYLCAAHIKYGVSCEDIFAMIRDRYNEIISECGLKLSLDKEFDELWRKMQSGISKDELASRGEYFSARLMAEFLGFEFLDAALWVKFRFDGSVDRDASYAALRAAADGRRVVIPGFYGVMPDGHIKTFSRGGSDITGALAAAAAGLIVSGYLLLCENLRLSNGFRKISAAALITLVCILGCHLLDTEASHAIIGTLMILTPGIAFTMGIRDFVQGDYLSGTIRMIDALLIAASFAIGTGLVLSLTSLLTGVTVV